MGAFRLPLILTAIALPLGTFANMISRSINLIRIGNYTLVAMMVVMLIAAHSALVTFSPVLSSKALADAIGSRLHPGDVVEINGEYEAGSTLGFYLRRQVRILNGRSSDLWYGSHSTTHLGSSTTTFLIPPAVEWSKTNFPLDSEGSCSRPAGPGLRNRAKRGKRDPQQSTVARAAAFGPLVPATNRRVPHPSRSLRRVGSAGLAHSSHLNSKHYGKPQVRA